MCSVSTSDDSVVVICPAMKLVVHDSIATTQCVTHCVITCVTHCVITCATHCVTHNVTLSFTNSILKEQTVKLNCYYFRSYHCVEMLKWKYFINQDLVERYKSTVTMLISGCARVYMCVVCVVCLCVHYTLAMRDLFGKSVTDFLYETSDVFPKSIKYICNYIVIIHKSILLAVILSYLVTISPINDRSLITS